MDQISGFLPQIGWSPLQMPATPKRPPASTVEPAAKSANTKGGLSAQVDTQTQQDHAQAARLLEAMAAASAQDIGKDVSAQPEAPIDPDGPTGPPPTFDVTPLEAEAARRMRAPQTLTEPQDGRDPEPERTLPETAEPLSPEGPAMRSQEADSTGEAGHTPPAQARDPAPEPSVKPAPVWTSMPAPELHQMDMTR